MSTEWTTDQDRLSWPVRQRLVDGQLVVVSTVGLVKMEVDATHPLTRGFVCPACGDLFHAGQKVTLVPLGPGVDAHTRGQAVAGEVFTGEGIPVHWSCATGEVGRASEAPIDTTGWDDGVHSGNSTTGGL